MDARSSNGQKTLKQAKNMKWHKIQDNIKQRKLTNFHVQMPNVKYPLNA